MKPGEWKSVTDAFFEGLWRGVLLALIVCPLLLGVMRSCHASEVDVLVLGRSWHFDSNRKDNYQPNEWNWGGGVEYRTGPWILGGMSYRDSFRENAYAVYGGYEYSVPVGPINAFVAARAGYLNGSGHHGPAVMPTIGIGYPRVNVEVTFIPKGNKGWNCVALFLRFKLLEW